MHLVLLEGVVYFFLELGVDEGEDWLEEELGEAGFLFCGLFYQFTEIFERTIEYHTNTIIILKFRSKHQRSTSSHRSPPQNNILNPLNPPHMPTHSIQIITLITTKCNILTLTPSTTRKINQTYIKSCFK